MKTITSRETRAVLNEEWCGGGVVCCAGGVVWCGGGVVWCGVVEEWCGGGVVWWLATQSSPPKSAPG